MYTLQTDGLTKVYADHAVVNDISLRVRQGEIYGFLGLNGAGKTTTIRMLLGMIRPASGSMKILGRDIGLASGPWEKIGYMVEAPGAYPDLSVKENLQIYFHLRKLKDRKAIDYIMERLHLKRYENTKSQHLSMGNAQRLGLAKALLHQPDVLILDEPANGLDPAGIVEVRELLRDLALHHKVTVFLSSHILGEISRMATRIGIIHEGKLIQEMDAADLKSSVQKKLVVDTLDNDIAIRLLRESNINPVLNESGWIEVSDNSYIENPERMTEWLVGRQLPPRLLKVEEEDLEAYFLRIIAANK